MNPPEDAGFQTTGQVLEAALLANPDDRATHAAYADWLIEQGDSRGEFIAVQLALEEEGRSAEERQHLQKREKELLEQQGRGWLGNLAEYLLDQRDGGYQHRFARGWLAALEIPELTVGFGRLLVLAAQTRFLRSLSIGTAAYEEDNYEPGDDVPDDAPFPGLFALRRSPYLGNVRVFQLGGSDSGEDLNCHTNGGTAAELVKMMPLLEEVYLLAHRVDTQTLFSLPLPHLRILQVYHSHDYPLELLAGNSSLSRLEQLLFHPHAVEYGDEPSITLAGAQALVRSPHLRNLTHLQLRISNMGDRGCEVIVQSGILRRLKVLDLRHGIITDQGARILAASPDLRHLERLDLSGNALTRAGMAALITTGVRVDASNQHSVDDEEYMFEGDIE